MRIGDRMKARRKELNLSADEVAKKLNVSRATIYRYEKGDIEKLPSEILEDLSNILNTSPAYLMGWSEKISKKDCKALSTHKQLVKNGQIIILDPKEMLTFAYQFKNAREISGLSVEKLSQFTGIDPKVVDKIEKSELLPTTEQLTDIVNVLSRTKNGVYDATISDEAKNLGLKATLYKFLADALEEIVLHLKKTSDNLPKV